MIDRQRAVNEIALVNTRTATVTYGVQSLFTILASALPALAPVFRFRPFSWAAQKAYGLISYNRRIILPLNPDPASTGPSLHRGYRFAWILLAWILTAGILSHYSGHLEGLIPASGFWREYAICAGQLVWQGALLAVLAPGKLLDYLGNMMTVSLGGGLALGILDLVFGAIGTLPPLVYAAAFLGVAGAMLLEHARRCRLLGLSWTVSASWVGYRLFLLYFILN
ncbi:hypothetical protein GCM10023184_22630 [Flaviaesturariibacter amylovorans]|uniref:DUF393 domain-containing protein n=1 Tax=Flaviaesturariibacter amylovorans TaxID=1084520 RepID=A0ABP8GWW7_9BACT